MTNKCACVLNVNLKLHFLTLVPSNLEIFQRVFPNTIGTSLIFNSEWCRYLLYIHIVYHSGIMHLSKRDLTQIEMWCILFEQYWFFYEINSIVLKKVSHPDILVDPVLNFDNLLWYTYFFDSILMGSKIFFSSEWTKSRSKQPWCALLQAIS